MHWNRTNYLAFIGGAVILAALSRLLPHPYNFTPMVGMALFAMAYMPKAWQALLLTLVSYLISDALVNAFLHPEASSWAYFFSPTALGVYLAMILVSGLGYLFKGQSIKTLGLVAGSISGSLVFYLVTNTAVWMGSSFYAKSFTGWLAALYAGIPFYQANDVLSSFFLNQIFGDLFFTGLLFGAYALVNNGSLKPARIGL